MKIAHLKGEVKGVLIPFLESFSPEKDFPEREFKSKEVEDMLCQGFKELGFNVYRQVRVPDRGDGRIGKIDFVLLGHGQKIAIEVDRYSARKKSIEKLNQINCAGLVVIRER